jgi:hypothetical protein
VFDECFSRIFDGVSRHKRLVVTLVIVATVAAGIGLKSISLENNVRLMLPGDDEIRRSMRFLQESHFSDKVVISLELDSANRFPAGLRQAVGQLEEDLGPPLVTEVVSGVPETDVVEEVLSFLKHVPQLLDEADLSRIDDQISPEGVRTSLRGNFRKLATPASAFMMPFIRSDPLGIGSDALRSLQTLSSSLGYEVELENGHFVSRDRAHAMLVVPRFSGHRFGSSSYDQQ